MRKASLPPSEAERLVIDTLATEYLTIIDREPGFLQPRHGFVWPIARNEPAAVVYTITTGAVNAAAVPRRTKTALYLL